MAKKPRSQHRKKGSMRVEDDEASADGELLSDTHTVADSISTVGEDFEFDVSDHGTSFDDAEIMDPRPVDNAAAAAASRQSRLVDALNSITEYASEKRTAKREGQLRRVFKAITLFAAGPIGKETVESRLDIIIKSCLYGLRVGVASPAEQYAACRVIEATGVVLGGGADDFCEQIENPLQRVISMAGRATPVRAGALRALSLCNFMCASDDVKTESLLDLCEAVAAAEFRNEAVPALLRATALDCWALLSTTIQDIYIVDKDDTYMGRGLVLLPLLKECLEDTNVDLRSAAGECVALIHECRLNLGLDDAASTTERRFRRGSWDGSEWEVIMDEVKRIAELSVESGHHMSKRAKKAQRATFREFMSTIVDDEPPCEVVTFRGGTLTLQSWREVIQLNFIRHCLQSGFQIQMLTNATLHEVFGASGQTLNDLAEKRLNMSKTSEASKAADLELARNRRARTNVKNLFLTSDGEDI